MRASGQGCVFKHLLLASHPWANPRPHVYSMRPSFVAAVVVVVGVVVVVVEVVTVGLAFGLTSVRQIACTRRSVRIRTTKIKT